MRRDKSAQGATVRLHAVSRIKRHCADAASGGAGHLERSIRDGC
ncbi:hypothetical protein [Halobiforma nitratireducens]|nr:hypothetical protein [Halobiforma nitratireducens]